MEKNLFDLTGKIALITGASRGIGESIARLLAAYGARTLLVSRKIEGVRQVAESITEAGGQATAMACHTGDLEQIESLFQTIQQNHGKLDILVNNAATNPFFGSVLEADVKAWDKTMEVNLKGYFFMSQSAAKMMVEQGGGAIVNVASINGIHPPPLQGIYSISKAGVLAMTKAFAKELAPHKIRVNALVPGLTDTKFASALTQNPNLLQQLLAMIPMGRIAQPDEMAGAVLYLVSDAASYTTGMSLTVDGGIIA